MDEVSHDGGESWEGRTLYQDAQLLILCPTSLPQIENHNFILGKRKPWVWKQDRNTSFFSQMWLPFLVSLMDGFTPFFCYYFLPAVTLSRSSGFNYITLSTKWLWRGTMIHPHNTSLTRLGRKSSFSFRYPHTIRSPLHMLRCSDTQATACFRTADFST